MGVYTKSPKTFTAYEALAAFRRVGLRASSGTHVEYVDDDKAGIGVTESAAPINEHVSVQLKGMTQSFKVEAAGVIAAGATIYAADDGKVDDSGTVVVGTALTAAAAAGDIVECLLDLGTGSSPNASSIQNYDDALGGVPFVVTAEATVESAGAVELIEMPRNARLIDAFIIALDTNAANVKLQNETTDVTTAVAKGTVANTRVPITVFDQSKMEFDEGDALNCHLSAEGSVRVVATFIAIE